VLSKIKTADDIPNVLKELENDGVIYSEEISREELARMIQRNLEHPMAQEWFSGKWELFTECNILQMEDGVVKQHRPDRVMTDGQHTIVVDYKTGRYKESTKEKYVNQVRRYISLLEEMGMPDVKGYLWYLGDNIILDTQNQSIV
jgi:CRISPR/Cas system-associated exonuclease Cas4 (RecB family)